MQLCEGNYDGRNVQWSFMLFLAVGPGRGMVVEYLASIFLCLLLCGAKRYGS